jgi:hypothetical protein
VSIDFGLERKLNFMQWHWFAGISGVGCGGDSYFSNSGDHDTGQAESPWRAGLEVETDDTAAEACCLKIGELAEGHFGQVGPANEGSGELPQRSIF